MRYTMLNRTVAPTVYPITTAEAKAHLGVTISTDDTRIDSYIASCAQWIENVLGRAMCMQTWVMKLDAFVSGDDRCIELPKPPLTSVTSIQYVDSNGATQTLASTEYQVVADEHSARIVEAYSKTWPSARYQPDAVTVTFVAGYPVSGADYRLLVPDPIKTAIKMRVQGLYDNLRPEDMAALERAVMNEINPWRVVCV